MGRDPSNENDVFMVNFDKNGFDSDGFDSDGFDYTGFNEVGLDRHGFDRGGNRRALDDYYDPRDYEIKQMEMEHEQALQQRKDDELFVRDGYKRQYEVALEEMEDDGSFSHMNTSRDLDDYEYQQVIYLEYNTKYEFELGDD